VVGSRVHILNVFVPIRKRVERISETNCENAVYGKSIDS
jgi:hypothetical protein